MCIGLVIVPQSSSKNYFVQVYTMVQDILRVEGLMVFHKGVPLMRNT